MIVLTVQERFQKTEEIDQMQIWLEMELKAPIEMHVISKKPEHRQARGGQTLIPIRKVRCPIRKMQIMRPVIARLTGTCVFIDSKKYADIKKATLKSFMKQKGSKPKIGDGILYLPAEAAEAYAKVWEQYKLQPTRSVDFYEYLSQNLKA